MTALIGFGLAYTGAKLDGPFGIALVVRWLLHRPWLPGWVRNGADCPFCWSFYTTLLAALLVDASASLSTSSAGSPQVAPGPEFVATWLAGFGLACFLLLYTGH